MDLLVALAIFCVVTLFTPGPNNLMLMASGLNFGFRRAVPHLIGVALGFAVMVLLVGLGLGMVFETWPILYVLLRFAGAIYLLYLAWRIAVSPPPGDQGATAAVPIGFIQAAIFQWVNPKAWVMAVTSVATYAEIASFPLNIVFIAALYGMLGVASGSTWLGFGTALQRVLKNPRSYRVFNLMMALLLVASLFPVFAVGIPAGTHRF